MTVESWKQVAEVVNTIVPLAALASLVALVRYVTKIEFSSRATLATLRKIETTMDEHRQHHATWDERLRQVWNGHERRQHIQRSTESL